MADRSRISWTDATWNPVRVRVGERWGYHCERVSPGCQRCYAERMNGRMLPAWGTGLDYNALSRELVEVFLDEDELRKPLTWRKPRKVFVESMSDLFGAWVPDEMIDRVFAVMAVCPQHTFQVLTKRAERMREWLTNDGTEDDESMRDRMDDAACGLGVGACHANMHPPERWPLPNVWLGVSVEDQQRADERIPLLLQTPAAVRWVSVEPMLGPVDLQRYLPGRVNPHWSGRADDSPRSDWGIDWAVIGGESGPGARPFDVAAARRLKRQCQDTGVPVFWKQFGAFPVEEPCSQWHWEYGGSIGRTARFSAVDPMHPATGNWRVHFKDRAGADPAEWPEWARVQQFPVRQVAS